MTPLAPDTVLDPEALYVVRICYTQDDFQGGTVARSHFSQAVAHARTAERSAADGKTAGAGGCIGGDALR